MSERDRILGRIREALKAAAPRPGAGEGSFDSRESTMAAERTRQWLPAVPATAAEWRECFARNAALLKADFHWLDDDAAAHETLRAVAHRDGWRRVASHGAGVAAAAGASLSAFLS